MNAAAANKLLDRALAISREISKFAETGDVASAVALDGERRDLLHTARAGMGFPSDDQRAILAEIAALNNRALGLLEHRLRIKARELDMAAVGRRAIVAYAATG
ncbi:MAG: hypothetical protein ACHQIL_14255 [Steroidobacterales bacterium]